MTVFRPSDATELGEVVRWAAAESQGLEIVAGGSKRALGRPVRTEHVLDVGALSGVVDYDPAELVLTARAATPLAVIESLLEESGQMLAFEPPDWSDLLADPDAPPGAGPTLGGVIACNLSGPRRVRAGAARDHLLGLAAVNGRGDAWKSGGTMVKNVTGYDLCKLQAGAYGTLSVLSELTVRALPRPETSCSLILAGLDDAAGLRSMTAALNTPHEVSAAAHLPAAVVARWDAFTADGAVTALRLEGPAPSVKERANALEAVVGCGARLRGADSTSFWTAIGTVQPLLPPDHAIIWRICPTPASAATLLDRIRTTCPSAEGFFDWGGGIVWLSLDARDVGADCGAATVREAVAANGGHATLVRASESARETVAVFEPAPPPLQALLRRVKAGFDPKGVLNPGRLLREA